MNIKILNSDKNSVDVEIDNLTVVEILRVYLNKESSIKLAAWKQEHPSKNPILHVETAFGDPKKLIKSAISAVEKDLKKYLDEFKKMK